jgi:thioester reductase-like protein
MTLPGDTILFTGFPGFLGSRLLPRVLRRGEANAACVVQRKFMGLARERAAEIERRHPELAGRIQLVEGDVTLPDLGLADAGALRRETVEVYHLAAVYDLSVRRRVGMRVNLDGTRHVLDFAEGCRGLRRVQYVSTCYVSGRYPGIFREEDLDKGQSFNNFYEETKFLAEVEVQRRMRGGLPVTIYRPAIVVGDSQTGATQKYDGPYYVIRWLLKQPWVAVMPVVGETERTRVNLVPQDFVLDAITCLSQLEEARGGVFHLADPEPATVDELLDLIGAATGRLVLRVPLPKLVAKTALDWVPPVQWLMEIPSSAIDYFVHPTYYTTARAQALLAPQGIAVPPVASYLPRLVAFVVAHPEISSQAMA